jgi:hypothetical protein
MEEQTNQARNELSRLEQEAIAAEKQAHAAYPEAPMTDSEK